jgi:antirestriction protein ArdC
MGSVKRAAFLVRRIRLAWLKVLKDDKRAIFTAASHAQRAATFLHELQPSPPEPETDVTAQPDTRRAPIEELRP